MSGNEISQILFMFVMPCVVKVKRRPLWTSLGLCCNAVGCLLIAVPHLISDYAITEETISKNANASENAGLCMSDYHPNSLEGGCDEDGNRKVKTDNRNP